MSTLEDSVINHLKLLNSQSALIAQMYAEGHILRTEQNAKALNQLLQNRAVRINPIVDNSFRLSPNLSKLLDEATHRSRNYGVSADFAEQMGRLSKLLDDYSHAYFDGRIDDVQILHGEIDVTLYEIAEEMNEFLLHVRTAAENNFGNVRTYKEKEKQNLHYLEQLERIVKALIQFDAVSLLEELAAPEREPLEALYRSHILDNLSRWRSATSDITHVLKMYLHKLRTVEPRARRIRALQLYLHRHPEYVVGTPDEYPEIPEWAYQHEPMKIRLEPDLGRQEIRDSLVDVAMSIEKAIPVPNKARGAGKLVTEEAPKAALIKGSPLVVVSQRLLNEAARVTEQLSAAHYFAQAPETQVLDQESCMMCFLTLLEKQMKVNAKIIRRVAITQVARNSDDFLSGNVIIEDVLLCKR
jgi:hypothetical protein